MNNYIIEYSYAENEYIQPTVRSVKVQTHNDIQHTLEVFMKYLRKLFGETTIIEIRAIHFDDTIIDLANYAILLRCIIIDKNDTPDNPQIPNDCTHTYSDGLSAIKYYGNDSHHDYNKCAICGEMFET
jgi:uncharacterized membrane protein